MFMSVCVSVHCLGKRATSREPHPALPCFCVCVCVCLSCVLTNGGMFWPSVTASDLPRTESRGCERGRWGSKGVWGWEEVRWKRIQKWPVPTSMVWTVFTSACVCYHKFNFLVIRSRDDWWKLLLGTSSLREEKKYCKCLRNESSCSVSFKKIK